MDKIDNMSRSKLKLSDLNPHLMCVLCGGYYIDATTIVECLHSFCRSCIVKHLESSKYCPICEVQVHKTKPLVNIRPDKTLQDIVYKLVPGLFASEMRNRRKFYRERPHYMKPNDSESVGEVSDDTKIYINDENITLSLDYHRSGKQGNLENSFREISTPIKSEKRYFKCPTGVTVYHLQKLLKAKYDLNDSNYKVEIYFKDQPLHEEFSLLDISYIYLWKSKGTLDLTYKIYESIVKRQKIEEVKEEPIAEEEKKESERLEPEAIKGEVKLEPDSSKPCLDEQKPKPVEDSQKSKPNPTESIKQNGVVGEEIKEIQLQISESGVMSVSQVENGDVVLRTVEETAPKPPDNFRNKTGITPVKVTTSVAAVVAPAAAVAVAASTTTATTAITITTTTTTTTTRGVPETTKQPERINRLMPEQSRQATAKPVKPYKTIRCSPKSWNPVIPKEKLRPTLMKNSDEPKKPLKFFKMRNMPRFLGNPASGVKPMYAESSEKDDGDRSSRKDNSKALKNILKIDPKTLRPIEKEEIPIISTPSTPNLLTNPFIPNNNHFLFGDPVLLHPNAGNLSIKPEKHNNNNVSNHNNNNGGFGGGNSNGKPSGSSRPPPPPVQNGTFPPICFPSPDYCTNFFPYQPNFPKPSSNFYPPSNEKMDPLIRASRLSPFGNLSGFSVAGFHASLPPSISLLLKHQSTTHHQFKKSNHPAKPAREESSTKETIKNCDDNSLKVAVGNEKNEKKEKKGAAEEGERKATANRTKEERQERQERQEKEPERKEERERPKEAPCGAEAKANVAEEARKESEETNKTSNNDNSEEKSIDNSKGKEEEKKESTCQDETSACNAEAKPETVDNNDNKSVNDKER